MLAHALLRRRVARVTLRPLPEEDPATAVLTARRSLLKDIRRKRRALEAGGELALEVHDGTERLEAVLDGAYAVEAAGWQGAFSSTAAGAVQ